MKSADGGFAGVYSAVGGSAAQGRGFAVRDAAFEGKTKYSDWQFLYAPRNRARRCSTPRARTEAGGAAVASLTSTSRDLLRHDAVAAAAP